MGAFVAEDEACAAEEDKNDIKKANVTNMRIFVSLARCSIKKHPLRESPVNALTL
jgi:hypothetical protein